MAENFGPVSMKCFNSWKERFDWLDEHPEMSDMAYCNKCDEEIRVKLSTIIAHEGSKKHRVGKKNPEDKRRSKKMKADSDDEGAGRVGAVSMKCFNKWREKHPWLIVHPAPGETELGYCILCKEKVGPKLSTIQNHEGSKKHKKHSGTLGAVAAMDNTPRKRKREEDLLPELDDVDIDDYGMGDIGIDDIDDDVESVIKSQKQYSLQKWRSKYPWLAVNSDSDSCGFCTCCKQEVILKNSNLTRHNTNPRHIDNYRTKGTTGSPKKKAKMSNQKVKKREEQDDSSDIFAQSIRELMAINDIQAEGQPLSTSSVRIATSSLPENQPFQVSYTTTGSKGPVAFSIMPLENIGIDLNASIGVETSMSNEMPRRMDNDMTGMTASHTIDATSILKDGYGQSLPVQLMTGSTADGVQSVDPQPVITLAGTNTELTALPPAAGGQQFVEVPVSAVSAANVRTVCVPEQLADINATDHVQPPPDSVQNILQTKVASEPHGQSFVNIKANAQYIANIQSELKRRLMSSSGWDATWVCSDGRFQVHKSVLVLFCPVFKYTIQQDETVSCIYTPELNCIVVKSLLCLFYTGSVILLQADIIKEIQSALICLGCTSQLIVENYVKPKRNLDPATLPFRVSRKKLVERPKKSKTIPALTRIKKSEPIDFKQDMLPDNIFDEPSGNLVSLSNDTKMKQEEVKDATLKYIKIEVNENEDQLKDGLDKFDDEVQAILDLSAEEVKKDSLGFPDDLDDDGLAGHGVDLGDDSDGDADYHPSRDNAHYSSDNDETLPTASKSAPAPVTTSERSNKENNPFFEGDHFLSSKKEHYIDTKHRYYLKGNRDGIRKGPLSRALGPDLFDTDDVVGISVCLLCYDIFQTRLALNYHTQENHKVVRGQSRKRGPHYIDDKRFKCPKCEQVKEVNHVIWFVKHMRYCGLDDTKANAILGPDDVDIFPEDEGVLIQKEVQKDGLIFKKDRGRNVQEMCLSIFGQISDSIWGCRTCYALFLNKVELDNHRNTEHNGRLIHGPCYDEKSKQYTCKFCGISNRYARLVYFIRHMKYCLVDPSKGIMQDDVDEYDDEDDYREMVDPWGVINKPLRVRNQKSAWICEALFGKMIPIIYPCHVCYSVFPEEKELRNHFSIMHPGIQNTVENGPHFSKYKNCFTCPVCKKEVCKKSPKTSVYFTHHLMKCLGKTFRVTRTCNLCNKSFANYQTYLAHNQNPCNSSTKFLCHICSVELETKERLRAHLRYVHTDVVYKCAHCDVKCKRKADLVVHSEIHSDVQYPCESCGKVFQRRRNLKRHLKTHYTDEEKQFRCHICPARFSRKQTLDNHLSTHESDKRFKCDICEVMLKTRESLRSHRKKVHKIVGPLPPSIPGIKKEPGPEQQQQLDPGVGLLPGTATINISEAETMLASISNSNPVGVVKQRVRPPPPPVAHPPVPVPVSVPGGKGVKKKTNIFSYF